MPVWELPQMQVPWEKSHQQMSFLQARSLWGRGRGNYGDRDARLKAHGNTSRSRDKEEEQWRRVNHRLVVLLACRSELSSKQVERLDQDRPVRRAEPGLADWIADCDWLPGMTDREGAMLCVFVCVHPRPDRAVPADLLLRNHTHCKKTAAPHRTTLTAHKSRVQQRNHEISAKCRQPGQLQASMLHKMCVHCCILCYPSCVQHRNKWKLCIELGCMFCLVYTYFSILCTSLFNTTKFMVYKYWQQLLSHH